MRFWYEVLHIELLVFTALTSYPPNCLGSLAGVIYVEHWGPNFRNLSMLTIHLQSFLHHIHPCINLYLMAGEVSVLPGTFCWQPLILSTCWWWSTFDLVISHSRPAIHFFWFTVTGHHYRCHYGPSSAIVNCDWLSLTALHAQCTFFLQNNYNDWQITDNLFGPFWDLGLAETPPALPHQAARSPPSAALRCPVPFFIPEKPVEAYISLLK
jgi:hypothetical protein